MKNILECKFDEYAQFVYEYALSIFKTIIVPWLEKYHLTFCSGNGAYYIGYTNNTPKWFIRKYKGYYYGSIDIDKVPERIYKFLSMDIPGMDGNSLGSLMIDYENSIDI